VSKYFFDGFVALLMLAAAYETSRLLKTKTIRPSNILILSSIIIAFAAFYVLEFWQGELYFSMMAFVVVMLLASLAAYLLGRFGLKSGPETAFVLVYPVMILLFMLLLNRLPLDNVRSNALVLLFLVSPFTDVFAFLVGVTVKGPKLCPSISPKKTISGAIGGLFGGMVGALIVFAFASSGYFDFIKLSPLGTNLDFVHYLLIGFLGSIFTQAGDLMASLIKRKTGKKDFGNILPGHGGIMDRIDGLMFTSMIIYIYMLAFI
jgi:phosphatidate cytidylyltransferase